MIQKIKNSYPEVSGLKTTPGMRKLSRWETFILFFRHPKFVWGAWTYNFRKKP